MRSPGYIQCFNIHNIWSPEGEERTGFKMFLKTLWLKNSQTERMKQISRIGKKEGPKQEELKQIHIRHITKLQKLMVKKEF